MAARYFWHRAVDNRWHRYSRDRGETLCGNWFLIGSYRYGVPSDARETKGPGAYCTSCKKADTRNAREARAREARKNA